MTLYQQEMLRKLGRLDCAGRYDEEKGLLVISSGGTGLCCQDKKGYLSWESEKIRTEEEKAVLSQIGEQAKLIRAYVGQYENSPSMGIPEVEGYEEIAVREGCSYQAVQKSIAAALKKIRKFLK